MQGTFYGFGSGLAKIILFLFLLLSFFFWIKCNMGYSLPKVLKALNILIVMFTVYGLALTLSGEKITKVHTGTIITGTEYLKNIFISLLPAFACYHFSRKGILNSKSILVWFFLFIIMSTGKFMVYESIRFANSEYDTDGLTNNVAYFFVALMPFLFLLKSRSILQFSSLMYILLFVVYGMKRGAILIAFLILCIFLFDNLKNLSTKKKMIFCLLSVVLVICLTKFIEDFAVSSTYFQYRLDSTLEGNISGRDEYYSNLWQHFLNLQNPLKILFGSGAYSTVQVNGNPAHNDWLEVLINNGIIGFLIYFTFVKKLWSLYWDNRKTVFSKCLFSMFIFYIIKSLISMSYGTTPIIFMVMLGYILVQIEYNKEQ